MHLTLYFIASFAAYMLTALPCLLCIRRLNAATAANTLCNSALTAVLITIAFSSESTHWGTFTAGTAGLIATWWTIRLLDQPNPDRSGQFRATQAETGVLSVILIGITMILNTA